MKKNKRNLKSKIDKAMKSTPNTEQNTASLSENRVDINDPQEVDTVLKIIKKKRDKPLKVFGAICLVIGISAFIFGDNTTVDTSETAKNALENKISTGVSAGVILLSADENIGAKDYTITHTSAAQKTKIWIWDFAAEDGDYVQLLVNGTPTSEPFMIKHKPKLMKVPTVGTVQVKGIRDGGGGITYAVRYDVNGTSYFNGTPEGELNTYELVR